ncbi:MAG: glutamate racemase, partial [Chlamydiia bacterium]|nr:glutamate racemase [Chlamydiia bacterium]
MKQQAIGVFDSGLGGLTVAQALRRQLPHEHMIYLGDTARVPYGSKSPRSVRRYAIECALFLAELGIKLLVIACNTASAHAVDYLSQLFRIPVLGVILPGAQAAVSASPTGRIGVIATRSTISSNKYQEALLTLRPEAQIWAQACPLFVPLVEEGYANHSITEQIAAEALEPGIDHGIDCLLLGCTHFPLLRNTLEKILCPSIRMID